MFCYARRDGELVARSELCGGFPVFPVMSVESSPYAEGKNDADRCRYASERAFNPSQPESRIS